ncbi:MAG: endonuclease/exonuclease/phosphatase family protein [Fidelibacterota bacterium]
MINKISGLNTILGNQENHVNQANHGSDNDIQLLKPYTFIFLFSLFQILQASHPIAMDGLFIDWEEVSVIYDDPEGDGISGDFGQLKITNDNDFIFFSLEFLDGEQLMQDWNNIHLYIDADDDAATGHPIYGIGAELDWCFGCRLGSFYIQDGIIQIWQNDLSLRSAPTITGERFEWCISRESMPLTMDGSQEVSNIKVALVNEDGGDYLPDDPGGVAYTIDTTYVPPPEHTPLERSEPNQIRLMTYNILSNGFFDEDRQAYFDRIIPALNPDILAVQEALGEKEEIATLMTEWIPGVWYVSGEWGGNYVISRFPILEETVLTSSWRSMAVLLDTEADYGINTLIINSHFSCCGANEERQQQVDELMGLMREWMKPDNSTGPFYLEMDTPIFHVGDFNFVGYHQQLVTLIEGDILDENIYGEDFGPDWDGSPITDLFSHHTGIRMGYTWRNDGSSFSPGKLDYILYSDSRVSLDKHFVLNTMAMSSEELIQYGLEEWDIYLASDHMPRVVDIFGYTAGPNVDDEVSLPEQFRLYPAFPNPFNASTTIRFQLPEDADVRLSVYDVLGREVAELVSASPTASVRRGKLMSGNHEVVWNASDVSSGVYFIVLQHLDRKIVRKVVLLK